MRYHTASHLVSSVFNNDFNALITGNQISEERCRIDFNLDEYNVDLIKKSIEKANEIIEKDLPILISYMNIEDAKKDKSLFKLANALPPKVEELRIVEIKGQDKQADGGTHINSLKEIGKIEFIKAENKGKNNRRVYFKISSD